jgi:GntR family transcriptional regulator
VHTVYTVYIQMNSANQFIISQSDKRPIYLQIIEQVKRYIAVGDWIEGDPLPSIRQLAADLEISVITVKRAYLELEREGIIVTHQGKGSQVAPKQNLAEELQEKELVQYLELAVRLALQLGMDEKELKRRLRETVERFEERERV